LVSGRRYEHLLFELDAFNAGLGADETLQAQSHSFLDLPVESDGFPINLVSNGRVFVTKTDTMGEDGISISEELIGDFPRLFGIFSESDSWADETEIVRKLLCSGLI
jgi:hypothetical protein